MFILPWCLLRGLHTTSLMSPFLVLSLLPGSCSLDLPPQQGLCLESASP